MTAPIPPDIAARQAVAAAACAITVWGIRSPAAAHALAAAHHAVAYALNAGYRVTDIHPPRTIRSGA